MDQLIKWVVIGALGALGLYVAFNWDEVRDSVASWLRENGLEKSALMDAWILFERAVNAGRRVVSRLFVKTRRTGVVEVEETVYKDIDDIKDSEIRAALERRKTYKRNVMQLVA